MQSFTQAHEQHHSGDPSLGFSGPELSSVTTLATTVLDLGKEGGPHLVESLPGGEAMPVTKDLETIHNAGVETFLGIVS